MEIPSLIIPSFIAGLLTFLAPCTLPLVPGYLGFIGGTSIDELKDPSKSKAARRKIFLNGLFYVAGFSIIFVIFGTIAGLAGQALVPYRIWLTRISGVFVILFGLIMLNLLKIPLLNAEWHIRPPKILKRGEPLSSLSLGAAFAFGWTPCAGPILTSVLLLASARTTALQGGFLLFIFSLGLAIPFLLIALGIGRATKHIAKFSKYLNIISVISGLILILLGILLLTNNFSLLISYGYRIFRFINYERILDYL